MSKPPTKAELLDGLRLAFRRIEQLEDHENVDEMGRAAWGQPGNVEDVLENLIARAEGRKPRQLGDWPLED